MRGKIRAVGQLKHTIYFKDETNIIVYGESLGHCFFTHLFIVFQLSSKVCKHHKI